MLAGNLKIFVSNMGGLGRGLVAQEDVASGEVLLAVPLDSVFGDTEVS